MLEKNAKNREQIEFICLENSVPQDHLLRKIDSAVDFDKLYEFVENLYCDDNGRPSIDSVILFKMVLIQHLYGITSLRKVAEEVRANVYYCWFLGYTLNETTPHFSTLSYNFGSAKKEDLNKGRKRRRIKRRVKKFIKGKFVESKYKNLKNSFSSFDKAKETFEFLRRGSI